MKHKHCKETSKKCKKAITIGSKLLDIPRNDFHNLFVFANDEYVTRVFWDVLYRESPELKGSQSIDYCQTCRMFFMM